MQYCRSGSLAGWIRNMGYPIMLASLMSLESSHFKGGDICPSSKRVRFVLCSFTSEMGCISRLSRRRMGYEWERTIWSSFEWVTFLILDPPMSLKCCFLHNTYIRRTELEAEKHDFFQLSRAPKCLPIRLVTTSPDPFQTQELWIEDLTVKRKHGLFNDNTDSKAIG